MKPTASSSCAKQLGNGPHVAISIVILRCLLDIRVSNSRRHRPPIANQAPHRHGQANSGTCRGRDPPHARHTFEVLPPETRPHKIDLSGYVPPSWHLCRTHPHGESQLTESHSKR